MIMMLAIVFGVFFLNVVVVVGFVVAGVVVVFFWGVGRGWGGGGVHFSYYF